MICPKCKITIDVDSVFCKHCGAAVSSTAGPVAASTPGNSSSALNDAAMVQSQQEDVYRDPKFEKEIWQGRPAWRSYYGLWALWALASAAILGAIYKWHPTGSPVVVWSAWIVVAAAAVVLFVREALFVFAISYRLTTQRLFVRRGIVSRTTDQVELVRIDDVRLKQGIVDRLVNTGDIEVISTDPSDPAITLESVNNPHEVAESLRRHVRGVRSKNTLFVEQV